MVTQKHKHVIQSNNLRRKLGLGKLVKLEARKDEHRTHNIKLSKKSSHTLKMDGGEVEHRTLGSLISKFGNLEIRS